MKVHKYITSVLNAFTNKFRPVSKIHKRPVSMTEKQIKYINLYLDLALRVSEMSFCNLMKVGAVAINDDNHLVLGWNGMPSGFENNCEDCNNNTRDELIHAEQNVISKFASSTKSSVGAILYITHAPCLRCAKIVYQSKFKSVYYINAYSIPSAEDKSEGIRFLLKTNVLVYQVINKNIFQLSV